MASNDQTAIAVLITAQGPENIQVDARDRSPFTHDALGGTPTFAGAWNDCVYMLIRADSADDDTDTGLIDLSYIPQTHRDDGPFREPVLFTKLNSEYQPVDFTLDDLSALTIAESRTTTR